MLKWTGSQKFGCMLEEGHGIYAFFQAASAAAAKSKAAGKTGTISLNIES
jgi:hypothetical protein